MERLTLPAGEMRIDGRHEETETLLAYAGAFQLTLSTTVPGRGVQLHSSYLGHPDADQTSAAHLLLAPTGRPHEWTVRHDAAAMPVAHGRGYCLLDHLAVLAEQLREVTELKVEVDVVPTALDAIDRA